MYVRPAGVHGPVCTYVKHGGSRGVGWIAAGREWCWGEEGLEVQRLLGIGCFWTWGCQRESGYVMPLRYINDCSHRPTATGRRSVLVLVLVPRPDTRMTNRRGEGGDRVRKGERERDLAGSRLFASRRLSPGRGEISKERGGGVGETMNLSRRSGTLCDRPVSVSDSIEEIWPGLTFRA